MLAEWLTSIWYSQRQPPWYLRSLAWLYSAYRKRQPPAPELTRQPLPIVVVGNVVAGGSGKTPLVVHLAETLQRAGLRVAVIARIYKGDHSGPLQVTAETPVTAVGDEPKLLEKRLNCPVVVSRKRSQSIDFIINSEIQVDIVISDDGLQHQALPRALEIGVMDALRGIGNGYLLPAGPLREPLKRLQRCQWVIRKVSDPLTSAVDESTTTIAMQLCLSNAVHLRTGKQQPLTAFSGQTVYALAGIAHPDSFFAALKSQGLSVEGVGFPDHYVYKASDLGRFDDISVLLMTEKDAVKCCGHAAKIG